MKVFRIIPPLNQHLSHLKRSEKIISLVPTMGYLHEGHLSLVRFAKEKSDVCVVSIFVNPTQFAPDEDFDRYPRDEGRDLKLLENEKCDCVFIPPAQEIYGDNYQTFVQVRKYSQLLEGAFRPEHFEGVTTIVLKLFNIVQPNFAVFGQKDAQQAFIIKKMVNDLNLPIEIKIQPIIREADGLAISSRNIYLSSEERKEALVLNQALHTAKALVDTGKRTAAFLINKAKRIISQSKIARIDYIEVVDIETFERIETITKPNSAYMLIAARFGKTRLIDNSIL
jgi:pantoate--beta-alanine ligase